MVSKLIVNVNGKELSLPVELTESQIHQIYLAAESETKLTGYEAPEKGRLYFYEDALGRIQTVEANDNSEIQLKLLYDKANCFTSEGIANNMARGNLLIRKLRRAAIEAREVPLTFVPSESNNEDSPQVGGYTITYNFREKCLEIGMTGSWMVLGEIVFPTEESAQKAINDYTEELIWYFTEMRDCL